MAGFREGVRARREYFARLRFRVHGRGAMILAALTAAINALGYWRDEFPDRPQPPYLVDVLGWLPWWGWTLLTLVFGLVLLFEAAFRREMFLTQEQESKDKEKRREVSERIKNLEASMLRITVNQPLALTRSAHHNNFRRLVLHNPNSHPAKDCYVKVASYSVVAQYSPEAEYPPSGFRFGFCTDERFAGTLGPQGNVRVDIVACLEPEKLYHLQLASQTQLLPRFPVSHGIYSCVVEVGANSSAIPAAEYEIEILFDVIGDCGIRFRQLAPDRGEWMT